jgi:hypothetical protein
MATSCSARAATGSAISASPRSSRGASSHTDFDAETELRFAPAEGEMAGLAALQNDDYFLTFAVVRENGRTMARVARRAGPSDPRSGVTVAEVPVDTRGPIRLQMLARGGRYTFAYSAGGKVIVFATRRRRHASQHRDRRRLRRHDDRALRARAARLTPSPSRGRVGVGVFDAGVDARPAASLPLP